MSNYNDDEYPPEMRVHDAISGIVAMTAREIATRADVPIEVAQRVLKKMAYDLEQRGRRYRVENGCEWVELDKKRPLPPLNVGHCITWVGGKRGYEITFPEPKPVPVKPDPEPQIQKPDLPKSPKLGQSRLFGSDFVK